MSIKRFMLGLIAITRAMNGQQVHQLTDEEKEKVHQALKQDAETQKKQSSGSIYKPPKIKAAKPKKVKPTSQPDFRKECAALKEIHSHSLGMFSGVISPEPGLSAKVENLCVTPITVSLTVAYLDGRGKQFGNGLELITIAPRTTWELTHQAALSGLDRGRLKLATIINVQVYYP